MAPPIRPVANLSQSYGGSADASRENPPSNNLWIGNVSPDVSETELKALFEKYGQVDSVTTYSSRNYAFVQFKEVEDSRSAKQGLQGVILHGHSLKIEFAKPARPCKSLWVAGISQSVSKEELENEFLKFGKIQEFRFLKDRNTAFVDYFGLEDATQALKSMNGKRIGGAQIRVDYLRSQSSKREHGEGQFPGRNLGPSDFHWMGHDALGNHPEPNLSGSKRKHQFPSVGQHYGDAPLSKILWIRYPPTVVIEEDMLHNALILFGEIERIKTFSDKSYAFVEFRSDEEARRAKEGLQGKLFNDPRILIEYFNSEFPGGREQASEYSLHPVQMDILGLNRPVLLGNNPGHTPSLGSRGPDLYMRPPFAPHNALEAGHGQELVELNTVHKLQNPSPKALIGGPSWNRLSPTPGIVSSPSGGLNVPNRSASGPWDVFDSNQLQRESKRSRFDGALPSERSELDGGQYGPHLVRNGGASGSLARDIAGGPGQRYTESDCIWRGLIAKGGTPVCRARCVSLGEWRAADIPDVVNCSARTGLDLLSKHYEDATGFDIVFFVPDSEEDFASYTEFLRYLGSKDRAGVAKFDDGTTLFLVPPSDFLTRVLKVSGPERLYGVVLQFPQIAPSNTAINPRSSYPQYVDPHRLNTFQTGYNSFQPEERILPLNNSRVLPEDQKMPPKAPVPTCSFPAQSVAPTTVATQAGLALTPELIATLTSLLPSNNGSGLQTASLLQTSSTLGPTSHAVGGPDSMTHWKHGHQPLDSNGQPAQQFGGPINPQLQHLQSAQAVPAVSNTSHFHQILNSNSQMHDHTVNLAAISSKPVAPVIPLLSGQVSATPDIDQHYQQGSSQDVLGGQGMDNGTDTRLYNSSVIQQSAYPVALSNQLHVNGVLQPQPYMPLPSQVEITPQSQPLQTAPPFGVIQDGAETEDDKNERYKTTLLFAANLLSRIHQPSDNQPGGGAGSH